MLAHSKSRQTPWRTFQCSIFARLPPRSRQSCSCHQGLCIWAGKALQPVSERRKKKRKKSVRGTDSGRGGQSSKLVVIIVAVRVVIN